MEAARGNRLEALYVLAVNTGGSGGAGVEPTVEDVNLDSGTLRVNRTIFGRVVSPPKTTKSRRSIKMSDPLW